jgi:hypothetical protein
MLTSTADPGFLGYLMKLGAEGNERGERMPLFFSACSDLWLVLFVPAAKNPKP